MFGEKKKGQNLDKFKILASFRWKIVSSRVKPNEEKKRQPWKRRFLMGWLVGGNRDHEIDLSND